jgi:hypothetical protein
MGGKSAGAEGIGPTLTEHPPSACLAGVWPGQCLEADEFAALQHFDYPIDKGNQFLFLIVQDYCLGHPKAHR